ncbi:tryptophan synthase beta chain 1-like [Amaranthus tricolor]|uniref:tryptophan synthase beta chain 1-like n=1 Tax=Amaranthus tricolor TaxID=29722 RepID=UPI00258FFC9E|nr:tryptophan synthase beta chain 1-like [Amaranthus tricolor]
MSTFSKVQSSFHLTHKLWNNTQEKRKVGIVTMSNSLKLGGNLTCKKTDKNSISINNNNKKNNNNNGRFGKFGGKYVPELLITCLSELEEEFHKALNDTKFQEELETALRDYVGRETPLYYAERLTNHYKNNNGEGPQIYIKREDLNHGGAHKINNALAQAMLAKRMGRTSIVTATGSGQNGVATAAVCAKLGLSCTILMGSLDMERQPSNVQLMKLLGAQVKAVEGNFKDASSEAVREWVANFESSYHLPASVVGPHPLPTMVREFQSVIGKEVRKQAMDKWGGKPDVLVACVGGGSNAMGLFHEFIDDEDVRLIGIEAAGYGLESGWHSATLSKGDVGVYHGTMSYLLQDDEGQIIGPYSIGVGLECPGVGPELSFLKDNGRAEFHAVTDEEALLAYKNLCKLEGIFPALEASHALGYLEKLCPTLPNGTKVVVNCSGRGDKDAATVQQFDQLRFFTSMAASKTISPDHSKQLSLHS